MPAPFPVSAWGFATFTFTTVPGSSTLMPSQNFPFAEVAKRDTFSLTPKMGKQTRADPWEPTRSL